MASPSKAARKPSNPGRRVFGPPTMSRIVKAMEFQANRREAAAPAARGDKERRG